MTSVEPAEGLCPASLDFDAALAILIAGCTPIGIERVPLNRSGRRRLAEPVMAKIDAPRTDVAAMDGYAVRSREIAAGRTVFSLARTSFAGDAPVEAMLEGSAVRVMTGAALPIGFDQVIVEEHVLVTGSVVELAQPAAGKKHVRERASDFRNGDILLPAGAVMDPRKLVVAAAGDAHELGLWRQARVACLSSGNELTFPGVSRSSENLVPDSVTEAILLLARQWGGKPSRAERTADDLSLLTQAAQILLDEADVLVIVGGAARGERDYAKAALAPLGLSILFSDVAIKPGKPVWYGRVGDKHVLGLPGNPTAAMTIARLFLAPLLVGLSGGDANTALGYEMRELASDLSPTSEREQFLCGSEDGGAVRVIERQSASMQSTLANADRLVRIPAGSGDLAAGTAVQTLRF